MNMSFPVAALSVPSPATGDNSIVGIAIVVMAVVVVVAAILLFTARKR